MKTVINLFKMESKDEPPVAWLVVSTIFSTLMLIFVI